MECLHLPRMRIFLSTCTRSYPLPPPHMCLRLDEFLKNVQCSDITFLQITKIFCKVVVWTGFTFASLQSTLVAVNARSLFKPRLLTLPLRTRKPFLGVYVIILFSYIVQGSFFSSPANCTSEGSGRQFYSTDCAVATYLRHGHTRLILDDGRQYPPSHKSHMRLDFGIATVPSSFF